MTTAEFFRRTQHAACLPPNCMPWRATSHHNTPPQTQRRRRLRRISLRYPIVHTHTVRTFVSKPNASLSMRLVILSKCTDSDRPSLLITCMLIFCVVMCCVGVEWLCDWLILCCVTGHDGWKRRRTVVKFGMRCVILCCVSMRCVALFCFDIMSPSRGTVPYRTV